MAQGDDEREVGDRETLADLGEHLARQHPGDIQNVRIVNAPPSRVFAAFSDPERLARWWGPKDFTNRFHEFDLRAGGSWRFTMHGPDGAAYDMNKAFVEVTPPRRLVVRHLDPPGHRFTLDMTFDAVEGGTRVGWRMRFDDPAEADRVRAIVAAANEENLDRLEACLAEAW